MANMCLEINTTRAISPQILRHRSFTFQEFSQRYATTEKLARPDMPHLRMQDHKNRQNSIDAIDSMLSDTQINDLLYKGRSTNSNPVAPLQSLWMKFRTFCLLRIFF